LARGYFKFIWYEELDEFYGMEEVRTINQTFMRGGPEFVVFYSYNPPKSKMNWVNSETLVKRPDRLVHHSDYRTVPKEWLGKPFLIEAEHLKKTKPVKYEHEYLGVATGTGGEVFDNVNLREINDKEIKSFDRIFNGIDWGYADDPFHFTRLHYDKTRRKIYIFDEIQERKLSNRRAAELIKPKLHDIGEIITADSAEPKSIDEIRTYNLKNILPAKKGPGSVEHGMKWLEDLEEIVIDPNRCPKTAKEFTNYELDRDKEGNFISRYPDKNNHSIDSVRYALESQTVDYNSDRRNYSGKGARS
jgi:PBSX family phage terminase large subunit